MFSEVTLRMISCYLPLISADIFIRPMVSAIYMMVMLAELKTRIMKEHPGSEMTMVDLGSMIIWVSGTLLMREETETMIWTIMVRLLRLYSYELGQLISSSCVLVAIALLKSLVCT